MQTFFTSRDIEIGKQIDRYNYMVASVFAGLSLLILSVIMACISFLIEKYVSPEIAFIIGILYFLIIERSTHFLSKEYKERLK